MRTEDYKPMTEAEADAFAEGIMATVDAQPPDIAERLLLALRDGLYNVLRASPDELVLDIRGHGELIVRRVPLGPKGKA